MTPSAKRARVAVVTGGTAGIGLAIAEALLKRGYNVFVCGRDPGRLAEALQRLNTTARGQAVGAVCDVRSHASAAAMVQAAYGRFGRIDALINSAGIGFVTAFEDIAPDEWQQIIDTNLTGVFNCCQAAVPLLKAGGGGDIVNLGSRAGRYSFRGGVGYNTTKFGLQGFTEALFLDLHQYAIRVQLVAPGPVATGFSDGPLENWHLKPEDVAGVVVAILETDARAAVNWVEIRPARPPI